LNSSPILTIPDAYALPAGTIENTVYIGYAPASSITLTSTVSGGTAPYSYSWSNSATSSSITVSPTANTTYTLTITDANGCQQSATITISVMDIRGGQKMDKVIVCHKGNSQIVDGNSITAHLAHGDILGGCQTASRSVTDAKIMEEESENRLAVKVLPNPSSGFFTILIQSAKTDEKINVRIKYVNGRTIEQKQNLFANQTLKVGAGYQPGLYFVEVNQGQEKATIKLTKF
jgi:hypothetical protein